MMGSSIGRRDVLKKGAVAAATAWTVPMIVSSKVGASSGGTCQEVACSYVYVFKVEGRTACSPFETTPCAGAIQNSSALAVTQACVPGASGSYSENSGGSVTLPPGYKVINVIGKKYSDGCFPGLGRTPTLDGQCRQTVSLPSGYSHMYVVVCSGTPLGGTPVVAGRSLESQPSLTEDTNNQLTGSETTTTSEATTTTSTEPPATTEATTTTSEATTTTSEATTTTSAAPLLDDGSNAAP